MLWQGSKYEISVQLEDDLCPMGLEKEVKDGKKD